MANLATFKKVPFVHLDDTHQASTRTINVYLFFLYDQMWVSAEEYQEDPDIIHKKVRTPL